MFKNWISVFPTLLQSVLSIGRFCLKCSVSWCFFLFFFFCKVFIQVLDVNDNSPKFTHGLYARMVSENVALGTTVEVVQANDADAGRNGQVSYKIGTGNEAGNGNLLVANHDSWNVFTIISWELTVIPLNFYLSVFFQTECLWAIIQIKSDVLIVDCLTVWISPQWLIKCSIVYFPRNLTE